MVKSVRLATTQASNWKRLLAFLIDYMIVSIIITVPFDNLINKLIPTNDFAALVSLIETNSLPLFSIFTISFISAIIGTLYFIILDYKLNQTIGKMIMNIFVTPTKITKSQAVIRSLGAFFMFTFPIMTLIDGIYVYFNKGQRLFEKLSNTKTVEKKVSA